MSEQPLTVDVRDEIGAGREPFPKIMDAVSNLRPGQPLRLLVPFEPVPLLGLLQKRGFTHQSQQTQTGHWEVLFVPRAQPADAAPSAEGPKREVREPARLLSLIEVDARGLEPPQPLVKILEAVATLPAECQLRARTDRRPMHLYPRLEERGFTAQTHEEADGSFATYIQAR